MTKEKDIITHELEWKCNTPGLVKEMINCNPNAAALSVPVQIFMTLLHKVVERAAELNDPTMNHLMCRLALYEIADEYNENYDKKQIDKIKEKARVFKKA